MTQEKNNKPIIMDVFHESAIEVLENTNSTVVAGKLTEASLSKSGDQMTKLQAKNWSELESAMETAHTERFNKVLNELPDREFVRVYIKVLPFFRQPLSKQANTPPLTLQQITINVHRSGEQLPSESKIIEINPE